MEGVNQDNLIWWLMKSLDSAFGSRQGLPPKHDEEWGRAFFKCLEESESQWAGCLNDVYMVASGLLYQFALKGLHEDLGPSIYHRPESLLTTAFLVLDGQAKGRTKPAEQISNRETIKPDEQPETRT